MEIQENEIEDILGKSMDGEGSKKKRKKKSKNQDPTAVEPSSSGEVALATELAETKQRLERVTKEMEGMKSEIDTLRMVTPRPLKIFALGFVPSVVLAKPNVELLKWVAEVLAINMKKRMDNHLNHFKVLEAVTGIDAVGVRTCPVYNRIEYCSLKWHQMSKKTKTGRSRMELRIHCCTLCLEALGIICGHPLLKCPWIYEDNWKKIPCNEEPNQS